MFRLGPKCSCLQTWRWLDREPRLVEEGGYLTVPSIRDLVIYNDPLWILISQCAKKL